MNYEVFLTDDQAFTWIEMETDQAALLLQLTGDFIDDLKRKLERAEFRQPAWVNDPGGEKLSWKLIKEELFDLGSSSDDDEDDKPNKEKKKPRTPPRIEAFDNLASSESSDDEKEDVTGSRASFASRRASSYAASVAATPDIRSRPYLDF